MSFHAFDDWWYRQGTWVEPPNQRRGGESGVQRLNIENNITLYVKRQVGHLFRSWRHPLGCPTIVREQAAIKALAGLGIHVPRMVYCEFRRLSGEWRALLVTEALNGFIDLDTWFSLALADRYPTALRYEVMRRIAETLAILHRNRWQHGCLYPKHIFVRSEPGGTTKDVQVALLDLEKCRRRLTSGAASRRDMAQLHRHCEQLSDSDWEILHKHYRACMAAS